jgi:NADPH:quinone reductase
MKQMKLVVHGGRVRVEEADLPELPAGHLRVRMHFTGISTGTELLGLSKSLETSSPSNIGYQGSGLVEAVGKGLEDSYAAGDPVACNGGPYVHHASVLNVPKHLVTRLSSQALLGEAAFPTLCAVALHGFRHAGVALGESVAVVGQGLLGNLVAQVAKAAGCRVAASETLPLRKSLAEQCGIEVWPSADELRSRIGEFSGNRGADAVLLAAANANDALLEFGYELVRRLGRIVIMGLADGRLPRNLMFAKEATVMVSRASGWGRYEDSYEHDGRDLPYEHARWTEHRNLCEVARLLELGQLKTSPMITDRITPSEASAAYEFLQHSPSEHLGVVIRWDW